MPRARGYDVLLLEQQRFRQRHFEPQHQARPRRRALSRAGQHLARDGGAEGARPAAPERAAPGERPARSSCRATTGGRRRSTASGSRSTTCSRASTASASSECSRARKRSRACPTIRTDGLRGGVVYYDGQFDDTPAADQPGGAPPPSRARRSSTTPAVDGASRSDSDGFVDGVVATDLESGSELRRRRRAS